MLAGYGPHDSHDDRLSRVNSLTISGEAHAAVTYTYLGLDWHVDVTYPQPLVKLTYQKAPGQPVGDAGDPYTSYDYPLVPRRSAVRLRQDDTAAAVKQRFGRTIDMRWETTNGLTQLDRFQWGYDPSSNRTWKANLLGTGQDEHYGYDRLYQIRNFDQGPLNINQTAIGGIPAAGQTFTYDPSGNWEQFTEASSGIPTLDQHRTHNLDNQLTQIDGSSTGLLHDRAGNALQLPPDASGDWSKHFKLKWDAWKRWTGDRGFRR